MGAEEAKLIDRRQVDSKVGWLGEDSQAGKETRMGLVAPGQKMEEPKGYQLALVEGGLVEAAQELALVELAVGEEAYLTVVEVEGWPKLQ